MSDLIEALLNAEIDNPEYVELYRAARLEIERCHARLEIDHHYVLSHDGETTVRKETPWERRMSQPDAVDCRDEIIASLDRVLGRRDGSIVAE